MTGALRPGTWNELHPGRDRWLDDHRPGGLRIAPAAAIAAWMLAALRHAHPDRPPVLGELYWLRPLRVPDGGTAFRVEVSSGRGGTIELRLSSRRIDRDGARFGEALIAVATAAAESGAGVPPPLERAASREAVLLESFHGPLFRGLDELRFGDERAVDARVAIERPRPSTLPVLNADGFPDARHLDALLQLAGALSESTGAPRGVPAELGSLEVVAGDAPSSAVAAEASPAVRLEARARSSGAEGSGIDLWCGTADGATLLRLCGYRSAVATFAAPAPVPGGASR